MKSGNPFPEFETNKNEDAKEKENLDSRTFLKLVVRSTRKQERTGILLAHSSEGKISALPKCILTHIILVFKFFVQIKYVSMFFRVI